MFESFKYWITEKYITNKQTLFYLFIREYLVSNSNFSYWCNKCNGKRHISVSTFDDSKSGKQNNVNDDSMSTNFSKNKNSILVQIAYGEAKILMISS